MRDYSIKSKQPPDEIRSDASANRQALIIAARNLFSRKGPEIPLTEIAKAANVSRATFYRNFPNRSALVAAVFHYNLDMLEQYGKRLSNRKDAFFKILEVIVRQQVKFHTLIPHLTEDDQELNEKLIQIFKKPVKLAKENNLLRRDFNTERDLSMLIMMVGGALLSRSDDSNEQKAQRAMKLLKEGLLKN